jgi:hypothetical protein
MAGCGETEVPAAEPARVCLGIGSTLSSSHSHGCAVLSDLSVACWGIDQEGQLQAPEGRFQQVSAGFGHSCAVRTDGTIACWGANSAGQSTPPAGKFSRVVAADSHSCAISIGGSLSCWGQLVLAPVAGPFSHVTSSTVATCALSKGDGALSCWHLSSVGPAVEALTGTFSDVSVGYWLICGVRDGAVVCWGSDDRTDVPQGTFSRVSSGGAHFCGLKPNGVLECWGSSFGTQPPPPAALYKQVSAGIGITCGVMDDDQITCWGAESIRQGLPAGTVLQVGTDELPCETP